MINTNNNIKPVDPVFKIWKEHNYLIRKMISHKIHNPEMIADALQESYFWVRNIVKNFDTNRGVSFKTYFYTAINNQLNHFIQGYNIGTRPRLKTDKNSEYNKDLIYMDDGDIFFIEPSVQCKIDVTLDEYIRKRALNKLIGFLTPKQQQAIKLTLEAWEKKGTIKEAALKSDMNVETFRSILNQGLKRLSKYLKGEYKWMIQ